MSTWPRRRPPVRLLAPARTGAGLCLLAGTAGLSAGLLGPPSLTLPARWGPPSLTLSARWGAPGLAAGLAGAGFSPLGLDAGIPGLGAAVGFSPAGFDTGTPGLADPGTD